MTEQINVAVLGASGLVGRTILQVLEARNFPVGRLFPLASRRSAGQKLRFRGEEWTIEDVAGFDFSQARIGLFSAGAAVSKQYAPVAGEAGCLVIDNTSQFRNEDDIPLVIPEVNPDALAQFRNRNIIANPNCSTIQMLMALKPLHDAARVERINVATYQSVSGAGQAGVQRLHDEIAGKPGADAGVVPIAFNAVPQIDTFQPNGYTREEMKMVWETQKILGDDTIRVNPTAVRVPVIAGHSEAIHIETRDKLTAADACALLREAPGVRLIEEAGRFPTAAVDAAGTDPVWVGRVREDISHDRGLNLWVVADNLRKGAALNSVQIAETWMHRHASA